MNNPDVWTRLKIMAWTHKKKVINPLITNLSMFWPGHWLHFHSHTRRNMVFEQALRGATGDHLGRLYIKQMSSNMGCAKLWVMQKNKVVTLGWNVTGVWARYCKMIWGRGRFEILPYWKWNFPITRSVHPLSSVGRSVDHNFLKVREVSLPCSFRSTC